MGSQLSGSLLRNHNCFASSNRTSESKRTGEALGRPRTWPRIGARCGRGRPVLAVEHENSCAQRSASHRHDATSVCRVLVFPKRKTGSLRFYARVYRRGRSWAIGQRALLGQRVRRGWIGEPFFGLDSSILYHIGFIYDFF